MISWCEGVARQFQIIEDESNVSLELSQCGVAGVGFGADEADGDAPESGGVLRAVRMRQRSSAKPVSRMWWAESGRWLVTP